jgi:hypothetical protein
MPEDKLKPALRLALRLHEIGSASPYRLFFAGKGKSGASFGFMQGDLAAGQQEVKDAFTKALAAAGLASVIAGLLARLSVHLVTNPLSPTETSQVNDALAASSALIDAMDEKILAKVYAALDLCVAAAASAQRTILPAPLIYMALWINMTGPPTKLLTWLKGGNPTLRTPVSSPDPVVDVEAIELYLKATDYYVENPGNFPHMVQCAAAGAALLEHLAASAASESAAVEAGQRCFIYEQATGNLYLSEGGAYDRFASGYSGSEQGGGKNNPGAQCEEDIGPLPRGLYAIGDPRPGPSPFSLPLTPSPDNEMCGRRNFLIHGDSISHPGEASHGCIILSRPDREHIAASGVKELRVVAQIETS